MWSPSASRPVPGTDEIIPDMFVSDRRRIRVAQLGVNCATGMKNRRDHAPLIEYRPHPELLYQFPVILAAKNMSDKLALIVKMEGYNEAVITKHYFTF
jgi:hypothetical protein